MAILHFLGFVAAPLTVLPGYRRNNRQALLWCSYNCAKNETIHRVSWGGGSCYYNFADVVESWSDIADDTEVADDAEKQGGAPGVAFALLRQKTETEVNQPSHPLYMTFQERAGKKLLARTVVVVVEE